MGGWFIFYALDVPTIYMFRNSSKVSIEMFIRMNKDIFIRRRKIICNTYAIISFVFDSVEVLWDFRARQQKCIFH